jgi:hypothetical protein
MPSEGRRPVHLAVLAGASVGVYAATLAAVAGLQSDADSTLIEARSPIEAATRSVGLGDDGLTARLDRAEDEYAAAAAGYDQARPRLDGVESSVDRLAESVQAVTGTARSLPDRIALPPVTRTIVTRATTPAHATTGASGK